MIKFALRTRIALRACSVLFTVTLLDCPLFAAVQAPPLLKQADLIYQGAFRLPRGRWGNSKVYDGFSFGGSALAFNPANNSLFIVGHAHQQLVAEISIPSVVNSSQLSELSTARVLQPFVDATEGKKQQFDTGSGVAVGGLMVHDGKLYVSVYDVYDAAGKQVSSHFSRPLSLTTTGQVLGPYALGGNFKAGFVSGYMTQIPQNWQAQLGGLAITGNCCIAIVSRTSYGPAAFSFDPNTLGKAPGNPLVYYNAAHPTLGGYNQTGTLWNGSTTIRGVVFPEGTSSVLFLGRHGTGPFCYGGLQCNDPTSSDQGVHAYPYIYQVWAYSAADFAAVKAGSRAPWDVTPYSVWNFELPFQKSGRKLGGVAYDPTTQRIFVAQSQAETDGMPMIHVFKISGVSHQNSPPHNNSRTSSAPSGLSVNESAVLTWASNDELAMSNDIIEIERSDAGSSFARVGSVEANVTSVEDSAALGSVCYRVRAVNQTSASDYSNTACAMVAEGADVVITLEDGLVPNLRRRANDLSNRVEITVGKSAKVIINGKVQ